MWLMLSSLQMGFYLKLLVIAGDGRDIQPVWEMKLMIQNIKLKPWLKH